MHSMLCRYLYDLFYTLNPARLQKLKTFFHSYLSANIFGAERERTTTTLKKLSADQEILG